MTTMKLFAWIFVVLAVGGCNGQANKEKDTNSKNTNARSSAAIATVRSFYGAHQSIWASDQPDMSVLDRKLDSIAGVYCTKRLRDKAKRWGADGQDLFTNSLILEIDGGIDVKEVDSTTFLISFLTVVNTPSSTEMAKKKVELRIGVVREEGSYKLDTVIPLNE